jgi:hypothetical protein
MEQCRGQVFWLVDRPTHHAFPSPKDRDSGNFSWFSSPLTAAGPRRILTVFPTPKHFSIVRLLYTFTGLFCQCLYYPRANNTWYRSNSLFLWPRNNRMIHPGFHT